VKDAARSLRLDAGHQAQQPVRRTPLDDAARQILARLALRHRTLHVSRRRRRRHRHIDITVRRARIRRCGHAQRETLRSRGVGRGGRGVLGVR